MAESAVQSAAETLTYFLRQKDFYLSHVDVSVMSLRNKLKALLKDVDGMRGYNESVQLIEVANNTKNVIDSFIFKVTGETSYQSTFNSGIKDKPAIEDLGKKIFDLKTRLDEIILSNRSQYGIHNIQASGEASTSSNQGQILSNRSWQLNDREDGRSGTFALSYDDLPNYLKPCFLYFGAFPENSKISVDELIRIWIAEEFVQRSGEKEMEDVAEDYVEELVRRSMIQVDERESNGMVKTCRINNDLRDLAISKAEKERFLEVYGNKAPTSSIMAARLAITNGDISNCISLNSSTPHLLSLLHFSCESDLTEKLALKIQGGAFKFLRVMHLKSYGHYSLPDEIGDLIHLRYLRLEMPYLEDLPSTITRLSNLQTLDIQHRSFPFVSLPEDIVKMEQIRHLMVRNIRFSNGMQLHHLSNLQTLKRVRGGSWIEDGLEKLNNLRDLGIYDIRGDLDVALSRSISKLVHLRSLCLSSCDQSWIPAFESFSKHEHLYQMTLDGRLEKLPEPHVFPPNLTELCLYGSQLERDPMVTLEKLPNLRSLCMRDAYVGKEMVCSAGGFPLLDTLTIYGFRELEEWRVEEGAMRNLRSLEINLTELRLEGSKLKRDPMVTLEKLPNLRSLCMRYAYVGKEMVCSAGGFPLLDTLTIHGFRELEEWRVEEGAMRNLRSLEILYCNVFPPNLTELRLEGSKLKRDPMVTLEKLPNLRSLCIGETYMVKEMVCSAGGFPLLDTLTIDEFHELEEWRVEEGAMRNLRFLEISSCNVFPPNLTELRLEGSKLKRVPMVTLEKLPNLRSLHIFEAYMGKEMVCSAGGFPLLDTLTISGFFELEEWRVEEGAMRNLRCLEISYCKRLKMLPDGLRYLITLQELKFRYPSEEMKERVRENEGEDWYKIQHIPSLIITEK